MQSLGVSVCWGAVFLNVLLVCFLFVFVFRCFIVVVLFVPFHCSFLKVCSFPNDEIGGWHQSVFFDIREVVATVGTREFGTKSGCKVWVCECGGPFFNVLFVSFLLVFVFRCFILIVAFCAFPLIC